MIVVALVLATIAADPATPTPVAGKQMVCRREVLTGTRFSRKICMTRAARDAAAEENMRTVAEMRSRSQTFTPEH